MVEKGETYLWGSVYMDVIRVARDQTWADLSCYQVGTRVTWSKRQPLPFPDTFIKVVYDA